MNITGWSCPKSLTENSINSIARCLGFNRNMMIWIKMIKNWYLYRSLSQLSKALPSFGPKKIWSNPEPCAKYWDWGKKRFCHILAFGLSCLSTNFCSINLTIANRVNVTISTNRYRICFWKIYPLGLYYWDKQRRNLIKALDKMPIKVDNSKKNLNILYWLKFRPITYGLYLLIFHINLLQRHYIAEILPLILMKLTFLQAGI